MRHVAAGLLAATVLLAGAAFAHYTPPDTNLAIERGKTAVGMSYLFNVDYVHAGQHCVTGMAYVYVKNGPQIPRPLDLIQGAYFHYRIRHLGLFRTDQYQYGQWQTILMVTNSAPDLLYTMTEIPVPDYTCDIEYYMTMTTRIPYYEYVDYTGLDLGVPGYSEKPPLVVTNRMDCPPGVTLPSGGTDHFIRVRSHRSAIHAMRLAE